MPELSSCAPVSGMARKSHLRAASGRRQRGRRGPRSMPAMRALVLVLLLAGCSASVSTDAAPSVTPSPVPAAPVLAGGSVPTDVLGLYRNLDSDTDQFVAYYAAGSDFCTKTVGTQQDCFSVRESREEGAADLEHGPIVMTGRSYEYVDTKDPGSACLTGKVNKDTWKRVPGGIELTMVDDCHGQRVERYQRLSG